MKSPIEREKSTERESGIELLKLAAAFMIILVHITQTLSSEPEALVSLLDNTDCFISLNTATSNIQYIILFLFRHGHLANVIFFVCSAWFLCVSEKKASGKKLLRALLDVWIISVLFLAVFLAAGINISGEDILASLLPTTFSSNWYITCYLIIYAIHPYLNLIIHKMTQRELLTANTICFFLYFCVSYIKNGLFFGNNLVLFIIIYFLTAYERLYGNGERKSWQFWTALLLICSIGNWGIPLLTNFAGLKIEFLRNHTLHWATTYSPFIPVISISLLQLFRRLRFFSPTVNRISSLTLYIYVIHENLLFRDYVRPWFFYLIYINFGYRYIVLWVLGLTIAMYAGSALIGFIYQQSLGKAVERLSVFGADRISRHYHSMMDRILPEDNQGGTDRKGNHS